MQNETSPQELNERLSLIQSMINEGRRSTESWGWTFVLWGIAYFVAIAWASWGGSPSIWGHGREIIGSVRTGVVWPVTMFTAALVTLAIGLRKGRVRSGTTISRAIVCIWSAAGVSMLTIFPALGFSGRLDEHSFIAIVAAMLGLINGASGFILRWRAQIACAIVWWITSVAACFGSDAQVVAVFLTAIFLCQIVFGVYAMMMESRRRREGAVVHA